MASFYRRGTTKVHFLPGVAGSNPTSGEMALGTDLSPSTNNMSGWQFNNQRIDAPVLSSSFVNQIAGPDQAADSSLTFLEDTTSSTVRNLLAKGTAGFIVISPNGLGTGKAAEVWPVVSTGVNREFSLGNDPARFVVGFAVTNPPNQSATLP